MENQNKKSINEQIIDAQSTALNKLVVDKQRLMDEIAYKEGENASKGNKFTSGLSKYSVSGNIFVPIGETIEKLPSGWYNPTYIGNGRYAPQLIQIKDEKLIKLADPTYDSVLDDINKFWGAEQAYRKFGFPYKRGILLYGNPGNGKTGLIHLIAEALIKKHNGVIFNIGTPDDLISFVSVFNEFRTIEKDRKVICVMEDVDNFMRYGTSTTAKLLNVLDGNLAYDNIIFIATTNFPDILLQSIKNRPSRFDRLYEVGSPDDESRRIYLKTKFGDVIDDTEIEELVVATNGFTLDMLKEAVLSIFVLGYKKEDVLQTMKGMFNPMKNMRSDSIQSVKDFNDGVEQSPELRDKRLIATKKSINDATKKSINDASIKEGDMITVKGPLSVGEDTKLQSGNYKVSEVSSTTVKVVNPRLRADRGTSISIEAFNGFVKKGKIEI